MKPGIKWPTLTTAKMIFVFGTVLIVGALFCLFVTGRLLMLNGKTFPYQTALSSCLTQQRVWEERQAAENASRQRLMKERVDRIQLACHRHNKGMQKAYSEYFGKEFNDKRPLHLNLDFLVARQQNIAWCKVPKVGSTSMVQSLLRVLGRNDLLHTVGRSQQHTALRRLMPPARPGETFPDLVAFMMVRHPFHRILSAYRDKILNKKDKEAKNMFRKFRSEYNIPIIKKYRRSTPPESFYKDVPTFPEFVDYLLDTSPAEYNEHWRPYFLTCLPCHVKYKVILNLETIQDEYRILVEQTGFPDLKPSVTHSTEVDDPLLKQTAVDEPRKNYTMEYYSQIPKWKLKKLQDKYKIDFEMFGYDDSPFYKLTSL